MAFNKPGREAQERAYKAQQAELTRAREHVTRRLIDAYLSETDRDYAEDVYGSMLRERGIDTTQLKRGDT